METRWSHTSHMKYYINHLQRKSARNANVWRDMSKEVTNLIYLYRTKNIRCRHRVISWKKVLHRLSQISFSWRCDVHIRIVKKAFLVTFSAEQKQFFFCLCLCFSGYSHIFGLRAKNRCWCRQRSQICRSWKAIVYYKRRTCFLGYDISVVFSPSTEYNTRIEIV